MSSTNPYMPPAADESYPDDGDDAESRRDVSPAILETMSLTRPWVKFLAGVGLGGSVLVIFVGLFFAGSSKKAILPGYFGIIYALVGVINLIPASHLWGYASAIRELLDRRDTASLTRALEKQKTFWRFVGIMTAVLFALYALALLGFATCVPRGR